MAAPCKAADTEAKTEIKISLSCGHFGTNIRINTMKGQEDASP